MVKHIPPPVHLWCGFTTQAVAILLLGWPASGPAQTLYDASLGTLPESQGWSYGGLGAGIVKSVSAGSLLFDTSSQAGNQAGWSRMATPPLDRSRGLHVLHWPHQSLPDTQFRFRRGRHDVGGRFCERAANRVGPAS